LITMNKLFRIVSVLLTAVALPAVGQQPATPSPSTQSPAHIILDTDMDSDCDDAGALALLHVLADRGEAKILAVAASSLYRWSVPCIEAINRYYGRPDLPIGAPKRDAVDSHAGSKYARAVAESVTTRWEANSDAPDATEVYRQPLRSPTTA